MLATATLLLLTLYGSGSTGASATTVRPNFGDRETLPLVASESLVFLGIAGDYSGGGDIKMAERLEQDFGLKVVGSPVRSMSDKKRLVWGVRSTDTAKKLERSLRKKMKKDGYEVFALRATVFALLGNQSGSQVARTLRGYERSESKAWAFHISPRSSLVWGFHEPKLKSEKLKDGMRDVKVRSSFHHQELELEAKEGTDVAALAKEASQKLDLVRASNHDKFLVLDIYLRDLDSFLALERGKHTMACPDVMNFLEEVPAGKLSWSVTLENKGYPFVN